MLLLDFDSLKSGSANPECSREPMHSWEKVLLFVFPFVPIDDTDTPLLYRIVFEV